MERESTPELREHPDSHEESSRGESIRVHGEPAREYLEGRVRLLMPEDPLRKKAFFNPVAGISRDLTVLYVQVLPEDGLDVCDALAGIGARGIRLFCETEKVRTLWLVDRSHEAVDWIHRNLRLNQITSRAFVFEKDVNVFFYEHSGFFDLVDLDPFGSPVYFLDGAVRSLKRKGYLAITATDQKTLMGFAPDATLRRYGIHAIRTDMRHEVGLRNLIAVIALACARQEYAFTPHLAFHYRHYYRIFGVAEKAHARTGAHLRQNLGIIHYCPYCLNRKYAPVFLGACECGHPFRTIYPTWIGPLYDKEVVSNMRVQAEAQAEFLTDQSAIVRLLDVILSETNAPVYHLHEIASHYGISLPGYTWLLHRLPESSRVHHSPYAIRTSASVRELVEWMKKWLPPAEWKRLREQRERESSESGSSPSD